MKKIALRLTVISLTRITRDLTRLLLGMLALAAILFANAAANPALDAGVASAGQGQTSYIDEEEENAYRAATKEPDEKKRAAKLYEFIQKYPKSALMQQSDYNAIKLIEEEYSAYYAASQETDFERRAAMLLAFIQKYPESTLKEYVGLEYRKMLQESAQRKNFEQLESLSETWLKTHPNDKDVYAFIAEAAANLKKYQKCAEYLEAIYAMEPGPGLAKEIHATYQKTENAAKQMEWAEKLFKMPELNADYMLRYSYVMKFSKENNLPKAAEYAQLTLKAADLAERKDERAQEQLRQVRRACHHVIASNLMGKGDFSEAISAFKEAIHAEKYAQGYYKIGQCLENQKKIDEAVQYYAAAELMGGEEAPRAKSRLEVLYKALHNDTLIGIDKVYKKAKELLEGPDAKQDGAGGV
jgi:tetratricopeptide (TPR) repeat protein